MIQLSHRCMTTGKTIALTIWPFVGKVTSVTCWEHILGLQSRRKEEEWVQLRDSLVSSSGDEAQEPTWYHGSGLQDSESRLVPTGVDGEEPVSCGRCFLSEQGPYQEPGIIQLRRCSISAHYDGALGKHTLPS